MGKPGAPLRLYAAIALVLVVPIILTDKYRGGVDDFAVVFLSTVIAGELFRTCLYWNRYRCPYCHNRYTFFAPMKALRQMKSTLGTNAVIARTCLSNSTENS